MLKLVFLVVMELKVAQDAMVTEIIIIKEVIHIMVVVIVRKMVIK